MRREGLENYVSGMSPLGAARVREVLGVQVRVNGSTFMYRKDLVEARVAEGARVSFVGHERVLMSTNGAYFDARNLTKIGLDYAAWLTSEPAECSICRRSHGLETLHEVE